VKATVPSFFYFFPSFSTFPLRVILAAVFFVSLLHYLLLFHDSLAAPWFSPLFLIWIDLPVGSSFLFLVNFMEGPVAIVESAHLPVSQCGDRSSLIFFSPLTRFTSCVVCAASLWAIPPAQSFSFPFCWSPSSKWSPLMNIWAAFQQNQPPPPKTNHPEPLP